MDNKTLNILIAETNDRFRNKMREVFYGLEAENSSVKFNMLCPASIEETKSVVYNDQIDLAFVDYSYCLENDRKIANAFNKTLQDAHLVMLIPDEGSNEIYDMIETMDKRKSSYLSGHILKDNYSRDLIKVLVKVFIRKLKIVYD